MSVQVTTIKSIPIRLHFTLIVVFFLITWTLAVSFMPQRIPPNLLTEAEYWIMGAIGAAVLFISVLLHELAHSLVALRYGLKVRQIILFIFGGISDIEEEKEETTKDFRKEFQIAVAGPLSSFAISTIFATIWWLVLQAYPTVAGEQSPLNIMLIAEGILYYGAIANLLLGLFNLIPAFPLDGGRILRAAMVRWKRDYEQATKIAVRVGIWISYGFMGFGFLSILAGSFTGGIWLVLIGWFLNSGAQSYLMQYELSSVLSKVRIRDIMNTNILSVKEGTKTDAVLRTHFNQYFKSAFPILSTKEEIIGMISLKQILDVPEYKRHQVNVEEIMTPRSDLIVMNSERKADEALMQMSRRHLGKVFVQDNNGKLVGLISKSDIMNVADEKKEFVEAIEKQ
ncbi:MAG: site-2 protease family protein [Thermoproteota archaeon]|nr:site-2 protease family protein [Thermoproteota archaeon]